MLVNCVISIAVTISGLTWISNQKVEGKVLSKTESHYQVDFSKDITKFENLAGKATDYSNVPVLVDACTKVGN